MSIKLTYRSWLTDNNIIIIIVENVAGGKGKAHCTVSLKDNTCQATLLVISYNNNLRKCKPNINKTNAQFAIDAINPEHSDVWKWKPNLFQFHKMIGAIINFNMRSIIIIYGYGADDQD